jgi:hypothetical protein
VIYVSAIRAHNCQAKRTAALMDRVSSSRRLLPNFLLVSDYNSAARTEYNTASGSLLTVLFQLSAVIFAMSNADMEVAAANIPKSYLGKSRISILNNIHDRM